MLDKINKASVLKFVGFAVVVGASYFATGVTRGFLFGGEILIAAGYFYDKLVK